MKLFDFQKQILDNTKDFNRCAYYMDMGTGKTFVGAEKLHRLGERVSLVVCQKSKVDDWCNHFCQFYGTDNLVYDLTDKKQFDRFTKAVNERCGLFNIIGVINYDLLIRRPELKDLNGFTLMLDESQAIANETAKRTKFVLKLNVKNVILLSGTPISGKYEQLFAQLKLLGLEWTKKQFWENYIVWRDYRPEGLPPFFPPVKIVTGYKNVDALKIRLRRHGAIFLKSDEVLTLPEQVFTTVKVDTTPDYRKFSKDSVIEIEGEVLKGDNTFKKILYERMLCGAYNKNKLASFKDLIESTDDRIIVFYNFDKEIEKLKTIVGDRPISIVNGHEKDLTAYENEPNSITFVHYQSGAAGLNLQKANRIIYYTLPQSSALFEQSKKRIHRIGQSGRCFYYLLICENSIEEKVLSALEQGRDYTMELFEK